MIHILANNHVLLCVAIFVKKGVGAEQVYMVIVLLNHSLSL